MLRLLIRLYERVESPDWVAIAQCLLFLDDAPEVANILDKLLRGSEVRQALALGSLLCNEFPARGTIAQCLLLLRFTMPAQLSQSSP